MDYTQIRYSGPAQMTPSNMEVLAFHLHRFLASWFESHGMRVQELCITLGFEATQTQDVTFMVSTQASTPVQVEWSFDDLCHTCRYAQGRLCLEGEGGQVVYVTLPVLDRPALGGAIALPMAFVVISEHHGLDEEAVGALQEHIFEAVSAARRNAMRLFFDEHRDLDIKRALYQFMEHLPEWTGCDFATAMILTTSLETMTLEATAGAHFGVLAERLFCADPTGARLVGMNLPLSEHQGSVLALAFERQKEDEDLPYQIFNRDGEHWVCAVTGKRCTPFYQMETRAREQMLVLVPLRAPGSVEKELLGFLTLSWQKPHQMCSSTGHLLAEISGYLGPVLRFSSIYTLGARKLWILKRIRRVAERVIVRYADQAVPGQASNVALEDAIKQVTDLLSSHVEVPSFAVAYMQKKPKDSGATARALRYAHPYGWAHFEQIDLWVDVEPGERMDSGVSSLAARLGQALVLSGGYGKGEDFSFKNSLFVNEQEGVLADVRHRPLDPQKEWVALSAYYKPARERAYATLAYPVLFAKQVLGVVTLEVEKQTDWSWWTGFGGHQFWQFVAAEVANMFYALGLRE